MSRFSKFAHIIPIDSIPYETIYRIARLSIVDKRTPLHICNELNVKYDDVLRIIEAKKQHNLWLDAIAALGREGLIK